ncbi:UDP-3-O-acyl-N-acetylglucosamine deacetylase [Falsiroseomonas selenitidurans]|uniref:UDP-3-O-acyl-N-acetylglucosamine deacetylase n=1 Tax=Falsiroseomonas selenitidurans TaxID=2716335 RepID=A0ABX1E5X6_9PROT|nr:UDP-3-O-acyl-N-acetylglucosamine deacetylase [Falsiroseomonas selenitidurans]NKC32188.1 UDP-3-O-acyl-N-acetylglucosamine deacetylase [Falsiroseomonas selenitidurans]OYW10058.1 MAG: UDP-3-O-[3-hydroxymyristoyl] N-acetylglucosamine deacetylase [Rhodospirillales bacterium 12-71-4]
MDGFLPIERRRRRTLRTAIGCVGVGLHSGRRVALTMRPAAAGTGIVFRRTDLDIAIPARFDRVVDTRLCTALVAEGAPQARIGTVEHVMAALAGSGVTDAILDLDGPEVPILDGSAAPFLFLIDCAGLTVLDAPAPVIEVLSRIRVEDRDAFVELQPASLPGFEATLGIEFPATAIGSQSVNLRVTPGSFREGLADARTFTLAEEIARLRAAGLAQGGSLDNAIVVDGPLVLNPGGLRRPDEFVRHKLLDVVGDLALAGAALSARFIGHRSGHALNNRLLRALFADRSAWRMVDGEMPMDGVTTRLPAAAAPAMA